MPTIAEILALPEVARGQPRVLAGQDRLDDRVRWVHISEHHDIARLMYGSELVLTTGVAWPDANPTGVRFIHDLADAGAAAVVMELVRRFTSMPPAMVAAATERGLPLIGLEREIRFIDITYAVHASIIDEQMEALRAADEAHRVFTRLDVEGATPEQVLGEVTRITARPVVFETLARQVTAYSAGDIPPAHLLAQWESRSRRAGQAKRGPGSQWLVTTVEARGQRFGRLVLVADDHLPEWSQAILERAATTLALNRLVERDEQTLERHAHGGLLAAILQRSYSSTQWVEVRSESLGVPLRGRTLVGVVVVPQGPAPARGLKLQAARRETAELVAEAIASSGAVALVGPTSGLAVAALLAVKSPGEVDGILASTSKAIHRAFVTSAHGSCTIGVGSPVNATGDARRSIMEAGHAAESVPASDDDRLFYRVADIGISGFAHLLRDDPRLQTFVERMLGDLISADEANGTDLEAVLRAFLKAGGNKSQAAADYGLSRPAFYTRLDRIQQILGQDLGSVEVRTSLHVALLALERIRSTGPQVLS